MPIDQNALAGLSAPIPPPGELATQATQGPFTPTQQAMNAGIAGTGKVQHKLPLGSGNTTLDDSPVDNTYDITGVAEESVGGNVGGVVGQSAEDLKSQAAYIPEEGPDRLELQEDEFVDTIKEGYTRKTGITQKGKSAAAGSKLAGRYARRDDRAMDRDKRQQARQDTLDAGGTRKEARTKRRAERRKDKNERKAAWTYYKTELEGDY